MFADLLCCVSCTQGKEGLVIAIRDGYAYIGKCDCNNKVGAVAVSVVKA